MLNKKHIHWMNEITQKLNVKSITFVVELNYMDASEFA